MRFGNTTITLVALLAITVKPEIAWIVYAMSAVIAMFAIPLIFNGTKARRVYAALDVLVCLIFLPIVSVLCFFWLMSGPRRTNGYNSMYRGFMSVFPPVLLIKYTGWRMREALSGDFEQPFPFPTI